MPTFKYLVINTAGDPHRILPNYKAMNQFYLKYLSYGENS